MFLEILQTLIRVLLIFSILIIAFGLAFFIVFSKSKVNMHYKKEAGRRYLPIATINLVHTLNLSCLDGCDEPISIFDNSDVAGANILVSIFLFASNKDIVRI